MNPIKKGIKHTNSDTIFNIVNYTFLSIIFILVAYPVIYVISASFSDPFMVNSGQLWLFPKDFTLKGYQAALKDPALVRGFLNALFLTVAGTSINILCTVMLAFPLSRKDFYGRNMLTLLLTITMFFSGGLVPTFLLINNLGLYDSYWALILPSALTVSNVIICRTYFQSNIPEELYESSQLDGCSDTRFLIRIALPLSAPVIAVLVMYYAVGHWNSYFNAMIYLADSDKFPLQIVLRNILIQNQMAAEAFADATAAEKAAGLADLLKFSTIVLSTLPMMIMYPFIQKHFVKGVMVGAIKG